MASKALDLPKIPGELVDACASGECVLFAGAGVGAQAGLPTWREGLDIILSRTLGRRPPRTRRAQRDLKAAFETEELSDVAELISARLGNDELVAAVRNLYARRPSQLPHIFEVMADIPFSGVLTANWDRLLEEAFKGRSTSRRSLTPADSEQFMRLYRENRFFILKLYGDPARPDTFLFTPAEFRRLTFEKSAFSTFLASVFTTKTILFVGASLEGIDDFLSGLPLKGDSKDHFALVPREEGIEFQLERFPSIYGIRLLTYQASAGFPEVGRFLEGLRDRIRTESPSIREARYESPTLDQIVLENIGPFDRLQLELNSEWNVLLGNNGVGKSTIIRAIALALCGDDPRASEGAASLLRSGRRSGRIELTAGRTKYTTELLRGARGVRVKSAQLTPLQAGHWVAIGFPALRGVSTGNPSGPLRDQPPEPLVEDVLPLITGVVDHRMDNLKQWILNTHLRAQAARGRSKEAQKHRRLRDSFFAILDELTPGLRLTFGKLERSSWQIYVDTNDGRIPIDMVSQGTSAILVWVGTLLERLYGIYQNSEQPELESALVLIDEIDAHMHPDWQLLLVPLFKKTFPNVQVIATTHSPLLAGTVSRQEVFVARRDEADAIEVLRAPVEVEGMRVDQILTGPLFGLETTRSRGARQDIDRYSELLGMTDRSEEQEREFGELRDRLDRILQPGETEFERRVEAAVRQVLGEMGQPTPARKGRVKRLSVETDLEIRRQLAEILATSDETGQ